MVFGFAECSLIYELRSYLYEFTDTVLAIPMLGTPVATAIALASPVDPKVGLEDGTLPFEPDCVAEIGLTAETDGAVNFCDCCCPDRNDDALTIILTPSWTPHFFCDRPLFTCINN